MHATSTATVNAPTDHVWEVLADHEGMSRWAPGLKVALRTEGSVDRNGIGAVRVIDAPGPAPSIVEEVVTFEPGRRLGYRALSGVPLKNYSGDVALRDLGGRTEITYTITADQRVPLVERAAAKAISFVLLQALVRQARRTG
ncbi:MAG TPA: SRPBCC family protein [Marmoricola sp.]|nr:SRPBCC family protein [Marmoricola sp.]